MDSEAPSPEADRAPRTVHPRFRFRKAVLWGGGILLSLLLISAGFMAGYNPRFRRALIGWGDYDLTVVHTNDTWGYLDACG